MLHALPLIALIGFAFFVEFRLQKEISILMDRCKKLEQEVNKLKNEKCNCSSKQI